MTPAQTLREAAARVRALADAATDGPWSVAITSGHGMAVHHGEHDTVALYLSRPDAQHTAAHGPPTALLVADLLDVIATRVESIAETLSPTSSVLDGVLQNAIPGYREATRLAAHILGRTE